MLKQQHIYISNNNKEKFTSETFIA